MISAKLVRAILEKIKEASTPSKFTQNYLATTLGFEGPNDKAFISFAKSMGFLDTSGVPTELYKSFRNPSLSEAALAKGLKAAYGSLYERNERFYELSKDKLLELVCADTGLDHDNITAKRITNTFIEAKKLANFETIEHDDDGIVPDDNEEQTEDDQEDRDREQPRKSKIGLSYNINLILPNTDDPKVFNAIFKSLKDNLL